MVILGAAAVLAACSNGGNETGKASEAPGSATPSAAKASCLDGEPHQAIAVSLNGIVKRQITAREFPCSRPQIETLLPPEARDRSAWKGLRISGAAGRTLTVGDPDKHFGDHELLLIAHRGTPGFGVFRKVPPQAPASVRNQLSQATELIAPVTKISVWTTTPPTPPPPAEPALLIAVDNNTPLELRRKDLARLKQTPREQVIAIARDARSSERARGAERTTPTKSAKKSGERHVNPAWPLRSVLRSLVKVKDIKHLSMTDELGGVHTLSGEQLRNHADLVLLQHTKRGAFHVLVALPPDHGLPLKYRVRRLKRIVVSMN